MDRYTKQGITLGLTVLPFICILLFTVSLVAVIISIHPDVKWNEFDEEISPNANGYYFHSLWSSLDAFTYETTYLNGNYRPMLEFQTTNLRKAHDETWKVPIRKGLNVGTAMISTALFSIIVSFVIHAATKQKLFSAFMQILSAGTSLSAGYIITDATNNFKKGIPNQIAVLAEQNYSAEKDEMKFGYKLAKYSSITVFISSFCLIAYIALYIGFAEGLWIWNKKKMLPVDKKINPASVTNAELGNQESN